MAKDQVEWVSLEDVMVAAERSLAPVGPELAGFIALEATAKLREVGGGVVDASNLAIGTSGYVALTEQPKRGDDGIAARTLRLMLGSLLEVATSSTPALRQCARRKDHATTAALLRELEGALIPLNRAASRRAVARLARATLEAIEDGRLEPDLAGAGAENDGEQSDPPPMEIAVRPRSEPPPLPRRAEPPRLREVVELPLEDVEISLSAAPPTVQAHAPTPPPARVYEPTPPPARVYEPTPPPALVYEPTPPPTDADPTPFQPSLFDAFETSDAGPRAAIADLTAALEQQGPAEIEIVSQLPPIVTSVPPVVSANDVSPHGGVYSLRFTPNGPDKSDRVAQLIESFEVSRRRDDKALGRDIKAWIGIETATSNPPPVTVHVKLKARGDDEIDIDHEAPRQSSEPVELDRVLPRSRGGFAAAIALGACALAMGLFAAKPAMLDALLGKPLPPPGDTTPAAPAAQPVEAIAPKLPVVCEASLTLDGVPAGSEVLRRLGLTPVTVAMPMNVALDLVATMEGHSPRRAHVDATALWQKEPTGARLDVPFALDATSAAKWPTSSGVVPLRSSPDAARGLLRATSTPNGASVWVVVDPTAVAGIPCGGPVDLMVVPPAAAPKPLRVEWSAFTGAPPRAVAKL